MQNCWVPSCQLAIFLFFDLFAWDFAFFFDQLMGYFGFLLWCLRGTHFSSSSSSVERVSLTDSSSLELSSFYNIFFHNFHDVLHLLSLLFLLFHYSTTYIHEHTSYSKHWKRTQVFKHLIKWWIQLEPIKAITTYHQKCCYCLTDSNSNSSNLLQKCCENVANVAIFIL